MKKKYLIIINLVIFGSLCLLSFKLNNGSTKNIIGIYVNDEYSDNVPAKDSGYYVDKIECDNGSFGEWDYTSWGLLTTNMSKKSKCNVYFKEDTITNSIKDELDTTGKCPTVNSDGSVNVTSAESENSLLCSAPDNYGTSYYFRGNVSNNYVYFAGYYWRIVRINGDNSIRIIYDGTTIHENGEASDDRIIGTSAFNEKTDDNAYVGYMYGTPGSSTYEETHANINDSTIKKYVDKWYENNIKDTEHEQYLADNLFCDDRTFTSDNTGTGYAKSTTSYTHKYINNKNERLNCIQLNDAYTVNASIGNSKLKYPIGIISIDEIIIGGGSNFVKNEKYYFYVGNYYWTMSAYSFQSNRAYMRYDHNGGGSDSTNDVTANIGVKPVINLKQGSLKSGNGTINNPYRIN